MRQTHRSNAKEALDVLTREKADLEQKLRGKEQELLQVQERAGVLLQGDDRFGFVAFSMRSQPYLNHLNVFGTKATLRVNLNTMTVITEQNRKLPKMVGKLMANFEPAAQLVGSAVGNAIAVATRRMKTYPGIRETVRRFYKSLDDGALPPVTGEQGRENVALLNEIQDRLSAAAEPRPRATGTEGGATWTS